MRRFRPIAILVLIPALAFLVAAPGCGKGGKAAKRPGPEVEETEDGGKGSGPAKAELASDGWGAVEGLVTYQGEPPMVGSLKPEMEKHKDKDQCLQGKPDEIQEQTWVIGPNKGVANVVIFLKAPEGKYFKIDDQDKKRTEPVELRQPHCAFLPHVVALYPVYYDGAKKDYEKTGELLKVINDAQVTHNTKIAGDPAKNDPVNYTLEKGKAAEPLFLNPQAQPLQVNCNFHTWMNGYVWAFDNPYHAVSKGQGEKDKPEEFGKFAIPRVPAGVEVNVVVWHPGASGAGYPWGRDGKKMTFKKGETTKLDFPIAK
jgi:hypothetical protein